MKSLYESILDDEDVLIGKTKESANNPLLQLYSIYKETGDLSSRLKVVDSIVIPLIEQLKLSRYRVFVRKDDIIIVNMSKVTSGRALRNLALVSPECYMFAIKFDRDDYITKRGAKCAMVELDAQKLKTHIKAMDKFAEQFNIEKTPLGTRYILW